jgi:hypothetical protein
MSVAARAAAPGGFGFYKTHLFQLSTFKLTDFKKGGFPSSEQFPGKPPYAHASHFKRIMGLRQATLKSGILRGVGFLQ